MAMNVYWAAPLFTMAEFVFNQTVAGYLRELGSYNIHLPQEIDTKSGLDYVAQTNTEKLDSAQVVVVNCDGPIMDDGTAYEAGRAHALGIPLILFRTDFRGHEDDGFNLVFRNQSVKIRISHRAHPRKLALEIHRAIQKVAKR